MARGVLGPYLNPLAFAEDEQDSDNRAELGKAVRPPRVKESTSVTQPELLIEGGKLVKGL